MTIGKDWNIIWEKKEAFPGADKIAKEIEEHKKELATMGKDELIAYGASTHVYLLFAIEKIGELADSVTELSKRQDIIVETINRMIDKKFVKPIKVKK